MMKTIFTLEDGLNIFRISWIIIEPKSFRFPDFQWYLNRSVITHLQNKFWSWESPEISNARFSSEDVSNMVNI